MTFPPQNNHFETSASIHASPHGHLENFCRLPPTWRAAVPWEDSAFSHPWSQTHSKKKGFTFYLWHVRVELSGSSHDKSDSPSAIQPVDKCFYKIPARLYGVGPAVKPREGSDLPACHRESSHWTPLNHKRLTVLLNRKQKCQDHRRYLKKHATVSTWGIKKQFFWTAALLKKLNLLKIQLKSILHGVDDKARELKFIAYRLGPWDTVLQQSVKCDIIHYFLYLQSSEWINSQVVWGHACYLYNYSAARHLPVAQSESNLVLPSSVTLL